MTADPTMDDEEPAAKRRRWAREAYARLRADPERYAKRQQKHQQWRAARSEDKVIADRARMTENMRRYRHTKGIGPRKPKQTRDEENARKRREYAARRERDPAMHFQRERERDRKWREENSDYYEKHRAADRARKVAKGDEGRAAYQAYIKDRLKSDINFRLAYNIRKRLKTAFRRYNNGERVIVPKSLGCTIEEVRSWLEKQFLPGMSWDNYGFRGWHVDHKRPLSSFDLTDPEQAKEACHYTNLQPLWALDNLVKGKKY